MVVVWDYSVKDVAADEKAVTRIAFDTKLRRPGCVLIQAAFGCAPLVAHRFPLDSWLLAPTPDMRVFAATEPQMEKLIKMTEKYGDAV